MIARGFVDAQDDKPAVSRKNPVHPVHRCESEIHPCSTPGPDVGIVGRNYLSFWADGTSIGDGNLVSETGHQPLITVHYSLFRPAGLPPPRTASCPPPLVRVCLMTGRIGIVHLLEGETGRLRERPAAQREQAATAGGARGSHRPGSDHIWPTPNRTGPRGMYNLIIQSHLNLSIACQEPSPDPVFGRPVTPGQVSGGIETSPDHCPLFTLPAPHDGTAHKGRNWAPARAASSPTRTGGYGRRCPGVPSAREDHIADWPNQSLVEGPSCP